VSLGVAKNRLKEKVDKMGLARLLVRINTLYHVQQEVETVANKIRAAWDTALAPPVPSGLDSASTTESSAGGSSFWSLSFSKSASVVCSHPKPQTLNSEH